MTQDSNSQVMFTLSAGVRYMSATTMRLVAVSSVRYWLTRTFSHSFFRPGRKYSSALPSISIAVSTSSHNTWSATSQQMTDERGVVPENDTCPV